ncbi:ABC transporter substrate-binding protein [Ornithinimicrobium sp. F0845]|uniref:ABC transporter substrate-binding protein n=1 Tax=Ornithinimicrobium sp. F0845 TaxID=2926412 RepID=UPI001FF4A5BB|nr:ABC transporter substrate-binding protein [Ornithinimicrobium sp. F0845]MCK0111593.1 ABC transporter substrate-binding protein [Ornithinimicrobium sp. F0845]
MRARRTPILIAVAAATALTLSACGGGTLGGGDEEEAGSGGPIKIGLLVPQSGVYKSLGDDMKAGFEVYLEEHDNMLGGVEVEVILADEGETADSGKAAADKLVKQDEVTVVTGVVSSAVMNGVVDLFETSKIPLVGSNASPTTLTDATYIWRTSYVNDQPGEALGAYVAEQVDGSVYFLAADYQAGLDEVTGFKRSFDAAGGETADEVYTPFPGTTNFQPFLANANSSGAEALFSFYAGGAAVEFVKQYDQFGLKGQIDHYSAGFLTEGGVLDAQGESALGTFTAMNYNFDLENELNASFVEAYEAKTGLKPTTYAMASYDAAHVLDLAIEAAGGEDADSESINTAIGEIEKVESPRGTWTWSEIGTPVQTWYLREVQEVDGTLANVVIQELGEL